MLDRQIDATAVTQLVLLAGRAGTSIPIDRLTEHNGHFFRNFSFA